jgi:hypothetical protein
MQKEGWWRRGCVCVQVEGAEGAPPSCTSTRGPCHAQAIDVAGGMAENVRPQAGGGLKHDGRRSLPACFVLGGSVDVCRGGGTRAKRVHQGRHEVVVLKGGWKGHGYG